MDLRIHISDNFRSDTIPGLGPHSESHTCKVVDLSFSMGYVQSPWIFLQAFAYME